MAYAALAAAQGRHRLFRALTEAQGLKNTTIKFLHQDKAGFVWLGSNDGLYRFDGIEAKRFSSDSTTAISVCGKILQSQFFEDAQGDIWFTTEQAINCYRHQTGRFEHFFLHQSAQGKPQAEAHHAFHLDASDGRLWVVASERLYRFDTRHPYATEAVQYVDSLPHAARCTYFPHKEGARVLVSFWAYGPGFEWLQLDKQHRVTARKVYFSHVPDLICYKSVFDESGHAWVATRIGLLHFDPHHPDAYDLHPAPGKEPAIPSICLNGQGHIMVSSGSGQLLGFDTRLCRYLPMPQPMTNYEGITSPVLVKTVHCTPEGLLWCNEPGRGIFYGRLVLPAFNNVLENKGGKNLDFGQLYEDPQGRIWGATHKDSAYLFAPGGSVLKRYKPASSTNFYCTAEGKTRCYSSKGLHDPLGQPPSSSPPPEVPPVNNCVLSCKPGWVLIGNTTGLYAVQEKTSVAHRLPFVKEGVTALFKDHYGTWWVGSSNLLEAFKLADDFSAHQTLQYKSQAIVNHIAADVQNPDVLWVATANGLLKVNSRHNDVQRIAYGQGQELYVQSVVPDGSGRIWMGTNQGLIRYIPTAHAEERFRNFTRRNSLSSNEYCRGAALLSRSGHVWFAGNKGVDRFHPDSVHDLGQAPRLAVTSLHIHDEKWQSDTVCMEQAAHLQLHYLSNTLRFDLAALEYTDPEINEYMVWLSQEGQKSDTVRLGTQHFITYANLAPGHYRMGFTACNAEGLWQPQPHYLNFTIEPPYWQTWWFRTLIVLALLSIVGLSTAFYYRYQLRAKQLELERQQHEAERKHLLLQNELTLQQERIRIADEMHDELGGGLSTIHLASERSQRMDSTDEMKQILGRVSQISNGLISNMRGIIWTMDSQNDSLDSLLSYLRQFVRTFLDDNAIQAHLHIPRDCPDITLTGPYRHSILLTVKECLNNIIKHAYASDVWFYVTADEQLTIHIRDNGRGFNPEEKVGSGKGLRTTVKRMESAGGSIEWIRNPEGGMTTVLRAPLK